MGLKKKYRTALAVSERMVSEYGMPVPTTLTVDASSPHATLHYILLLDDDAVATIEKISHLAEKSDWSVGQTFVSATEMIDDVLVSVQVMIPARDRWTPEVRTALMKAGWHGANESIV